MGTLPVIDQSDATRHAKFYDFEEDGECTHRLGLLTIREREVLTLILEGKVSCEIASQIGIAQTTVQNYMNHVNRKLGRFAPYRRLSQSKDSNTVNSKPK